MFKQLLMMSGMDKYYQIARCFRDEDLRADRQPEFTQIDIEASFIDERDIMALTEGMVKRLFAEVLQRRLPDFPVLTFDDAMRRYGSDKPDLRNPLELVDVADLVRRVEFKVFNAPANDPKGRVVALRAPGAGRLSRKELDGYAEFVGRYGAKGLAYIKVNERGTGAAGLQSPILKFLPEPVDRGGARPRAARSPATSCSSAPISAASSTTRSARCAINSAHDLGLIEDRWAPCWIVDWPMFERGKEGRLEAMHHPFTSPACSVEELLANPEAAHARAYDVVLNGYELGGGSIRMHRNEMQKAVFEIAAAGSGSGSAFRIPARRAEVRLSAARRHRARCRPPRDADGRCRRNSRRHRVSENADRGVSADGGADRGGRTSAARTAHSLAIRRATVTRILGIDPGSRVTGYGVIDVRRGKSVYVASGCIRTTQRRRAGATR